MMRRKDIRRRACKRLSRKNVGCPALLRSTNHRQERGAKRGWRVEKGELKQVSDLLNTCANSFHPRDINFKGEDEE